MCLDTGLGFGRTQDLICIQIFQQGRDRAKKEALFAALAKGLEASCGVKGNDLIVSVFANSPEDWSFRYGEAQFLNGKL